MDGISSKIPFYVTQQFQSTYPIYSSGYKQVPEKYNFFILFVFLHNWMFLFLLLFLSLSLPLSFSTPLYFSVSSPLSLSFSHSHSLFLSLSLSLSLFLSLSLYILSFFLYPHRWSGPLRETIDSTLRFSVEQKKKSDHEEFTRYVCGDEFFFENIYED